MKILRLVFVIASLGLMLASSGLDGAYLARIMPPVLGYILNTTTDIVSEVLMYAFGRIRQTAQRGSKKWKMTRWLVVVNVALVLYAWFFGWRELLIVLPQVEARAALWVAPIIAGFVPIAIVGAGLAQALVDGRIEDAKTTQDVPREEIKSVAEPASLAPEPEPAIINLRQFRAIITSPNGSEAAIARMLANESGNRAESVNGLLAALGYECIPESTARGWWRIAREMMGANGG